MKNSAIIRAAVLWSRGKADSVISAENLVVGSGERHSAPVSVDVPAGALVLVTGSRADRRAFTWTLAGRQLPVAGRAHVGGHPLPSESVRVARIVAVAQTAGINSATSARTLGDLLAARLQITRPWYRVFASGPLCCTGSPDSMRQSAPARDSTRSGSRRQPNSHSFDRSSARSLWPRWRCAERPAVLMLEQADTLWEVTKRRYSVLISSAR